MVSARYIGKQSASARAWRAAFLGTACSCAAACVTPLPDDRPALAEDRAEDIVAVIDVISVRDFERDECFGYILQAPDGTPEVFCASPPPFNVWAKVVTQLYGPHVPQSISFKTASHWGHRTLTDGNLKLVHLVTDGTVVLMPNEAAADVGTDQRGDLFTPSYGEIGWLPCGTDALKERVIFRSPTDRFAEEWQEPAFPTPPERLARDNFYFVNDGEHQYPRFGIALDSISEFLHDKHPARDDFSCIEE